jgi:hypothetical protein
MLSPVLGDASNRHISFEMVIVGLGRSVSWQNGDHLLKVIDDLLKISRQRIYGQPIARKALEYHAKVIFITAD